MRCRDTAIDRRGYVSPLDDGDLEILVEYKRIHEDSMDFSTLKAFFNMLIL